MGHYYLDTQYIKLRQYLMLRYLYLVFAESTNTKKTFCIHCMSKTYWPILIVTYKKKTYWTYTVSKTICRYWCIMIYFRKKNNVKKFGSSDRFLFAGYKWIYQFWIWYFSYGKLYIRVRISGTMCPRSSDPFKIVFLLYKTGHTLLDKHYYIQEVLSVILCSR